MNQQSKVSHYFRIELKEAKLVRGSKGSSDIDTIIAFADKERVRVSLADEAFLRRKNVLPEGIRFSYRNKYEFAKFRVHTFNRTKELFF